MSAGADFNKHKNITKSFKKSKWFRYIKSETIDLYMCEIWSVYSYKMPCFVQKIKIGGIAEIY